MPISGSVGMAKGFLIALSWRFPCHATMHAELITGLREFRCTWSHRHAYQVFKNYWWLLKKKKNTLLLLERKGFGLFSVLKYVISNCRPPRGKWAC